MTSEREKDVGTSTAILLHFAPALAIAAAYLVLTRVVTTVGLPRVSALLGALVLVGIPLQLGIVRHISRSVGHSVVRFRTAIPLRQHVVGAFAIIVIVFCLLQLPLGRASQYLATHAFSWVPVAFSPAADDDLAATSRNILLPILLLQLLIDGIVNPFVEERYFRGFLLPQLAGLRVIAPVVSTVLFSLSHFWQPHNYLSIFVYVLPATVFTWWHRNYYAQAFVHCFANSLGATLALVAFVRATP